MFKKIFAPQYPLLITYLAISILCLPLAYVFLWASDSQALREYFYYVLAIIQLFFAGWITVRIIQMIWNMIKNKQFSWKNLWFIVVTAIVFFVTFWTSVFTGLLLVGFS